MKQPSWDVLHTRQVLVTDLIVFLVYPYNNHVGHLYSPIEGEWHA